ncbi:hypothetical protein ACLOJK_022626, partial [Asimina triloba]
MDQSPGPASSQASIALIRAEQPWPSVHQATATIKIGDLSAPSTARIGPTSAFRNPSIQAS